MCPGWPRGYAISLQSPQRGFCQVVVQSLRHNMILTEQKRSQIPATKHKAFSLIGSSVSNCKDMWHVEFGKERKWNPTGSVKFDIFQNSSLVLRTDLRNQLLYIKLHNIPVIKGTCNQDFNSEGVVDGFYYKKMSFGGSLLLPILFLKFPAMFSINNRLRFTKADNRRECRKKIDKSRSICILRCAEGIRNKGFILDGRVVMASDFNPLNVAPVKSLCSLYAILWF
ncbi:hypothetical protein CEXT_221911 [Caerostris extrusa]|uniref:Uncharacterized protein n=1 Tax=Caerostris extrusa TaxID=172846 RepID=A0AAV4XCW5_CAEEX|nr:hypothetical protein CEXT_221911 [Caerostris extrusa]